MNSIKYIFLISLFFPLKLSTIINFREPRDALKIVKKYLPDNPIILEAGSFDGEDTIFVANFWPYSTIYSFEPVPQIYKKFCKNTKKYAQIKGFNIALGDSCGKKSFYVSSDAKTPHIPSQSSSLLQPKEHLIYAPHIQFNKVIEVDCFTIDAWAAENNVKKIDLMWLDMQGNELQTLQASPNILNTIKAIITEVEFVEAYKGQSLYEDVKQWLESQGFTLVALSTTPEWFGDAIFVRL
ncbi:MAG: FkbM family methyltransferase [Candidatus Babeliaceae bacterium]|nr:FkbM family methyltransferase [Candidatus Babeliaceae bacterium]